MLGRFSPNTIHPLLELVSLGAFPPRQRRAIKLHTLLDLRMAPSPHLSRFSHGKMADVRIPG